MIIVGRPINGISINGNEYLLDANNKPIEFENIDSAIKFLRENGIELTDEEMRDSFSFEEVE